MFRERGCLVMPYKDPIKAREHQREYYSKHKQNWKLEDGTWKRPPIEKARVYNKKSYYKRREAVREHQNKKYRDEHPIKYGICPICKIHNRLVWDHDHSTNVFRDYICSQCNVMLGMAKDKKEILYGGADYLGRHEK